MSSPITKSEIIIRPPPDGFDRWAQKYQRTESEVAIIEKADNNNVDQKGFGKQVEDLFRKIYSSSSLDAVNIMPDEILWEELERAVGFEHGISDTDRGIMKRPRPDLLKAFYFRARVQSSVFTVFMQLVQGLLSLEVPLVTPLDTSNCEHDDIRELMLALVGSFKSLRDLTNESNLNIYRCYFIDSFRGYDKPIQWLATMIVRGFKTQNLWTLIDRMALYGEFGDLNVKRLRELWAEDRLIQIDSTTGVNRFMNVPHYSPGPFTNLVWLLPIRIEDGEHQLDVQSRFERRFKKIESLFFRYFKLPVYARLPNQELPWEYIEDKGILWMSERVEDPEQV